MELTTRQSYPVLLYHLTHEVDKLFKNKEALFPVVIILKIVISEKRKELVHCLC